MQSAKDIQQSRFPGTGWPEQYDALALKDVEMDVPQRMHIASPM